MTDHIALHANFWGFRRLMEPYWTTPEFVDASRFAKTEAGEVLKNNGLWEAFIAFATSRHAQTVASDALDAVLRKNISYSRNHVREMDERNELGDLAMMLLTAIGPQPITKPEFDVAARYASHIDNDFLLDRIVHMVSTVHMAAYLWQDHNYLRRYAITTLILIDRYPGMNLERILHSRIARIYRKHHPDAGKTAPYPTKDEGLRLEDLTGYYPE